MAAISISPDVVQDVLGRALRTGGGVFDLSARFIGNWVSLDIGGDWFLFSYGRLVAAGVLVVGRRRVWYKDREFHSQTTSKHINLFIRQGFNLDADVVQAEQVGYPELAGLLVQACHNL